MGKDLGWLFSGVLLITFGILHEMMLYWLQLKKQWYSQKFGKYDFAIHGIQLGGIWILVGLCLIGLFWHMPLYPFHHHSFFRALGSNADGGPSYLCPDLLSGNGTVGSFREHLE